MILIVGGDSDDIIDEEFEVFFDDLYGKGQFVISVVFVFEFKVLVVFVLLNLSSDEEIIDDEFEVFFDQLYGLG